jgi:Zn-dependent protease with chaperone function
MGMPSSGSGPAPQGVALLLGYLALLLPGLVVGSLPESWLGSRSPMRFSPRRMALLALWMTMASSLSLAQGAALLGGITHAEEVAVGLLLLNFWLSDSLSLEPFTPLQPKALPGQLRRLAGNLGISLPVVVLVLAGLGLSAVASLVFKTGGAGGLLPPWLEPLGTLALYLFVAGLVIPVLVPLCWRLRELEDRQATGIIREELEAGGVSVARVLNWPVMMTGSATAGVIGLLPRFRYLLFSDVLAATLTPDEIRSVTAHEATHLRQRHLWYFVAAILAYVLCIHVALQALLLAGLWLHYSLPFWAITLIEVGGLLLFLRFGIGYLSRNFERQADGGALRRMGLEPFRSALLKIGVLNRISPEADNWHHYGIGRRLAYLESAQDEPAALAGHDHKVGRIKLACIALLTAGLIAQAVFSSPGVVAFLIEKVWLQGIGDDSGHAAQPTESDIEGLHYLALQAFQRGDLEVAERYFRRLLEFSPENPEISNNLAWLLVTRPGADPADLAEGLRLARQAVQASDSAYIWDTLAEALARGGQSGAARDAAARALGLAGQEQGRGNTPLTYYRERLEAFEASGWKNKKINP